MKYFLLFLVFSSFLFAYEIEILKPIEKDGVVEFPIKIRADEPYTAFQFTLTYEKGLKYEGFEWGKITEGSLNALNDKMENKIKGALASATPLPSEGILFYIRFKGKGEINFTEFLVQDKPAKIKGKLNLKKK